MQNLPKNNSQSSYHVIMSIKLQPLHIYDLLGFRTKKKKKITIIRREKRTLRFPVRVDLASTRAWRGRLGLRGGQKERGWRLVLYRFPQLVLWIRPTELFRAASGVRIGLVEAQWLKKFSFFEPSFVILLGTAINASGYHYMRTRITSGMRHLPLNVKRW